MLVVDDDPTLRQTLQDVLSEIGWDSETAPNGLEGVRAAVQGGYAAILLDYQLPDIDGLEVLDRLRAAGVQTPVIAITGKGDEEIATQFLTRGAVDYLPKPNLTPPRLEITLDRAVWVAQGDEDPSASPASEGEADTRRILLRTDEDALQELILEGMREASWRGKLIRITELDEIDPFLDAQPVSAIVLDLRDCEVVGPVLDRVTATVDEPVLAIVSDETDATTQDERPQSACITMDELDGPRLETVLSRLVGPREDG